MRVLLDECVDWRLLRDLTEYDTKTVKQLGWERNDDGSLLSRAAAEFDVFITVDKDLPNEQNLSRFDVALSCCGVGQHGFRICANCWNCCVRPFDAPSLASFRL